MLARAIIATALLFSASAEARSSSSGYSYKAPSYGTGSNPSSRGVSGYTKRDGTYVAPYRQTVPNSTTRDNYSAPGNYNPWKPSKK